MDNSLAHELLIIRRPRDPLPVRAILRRGRHGADAAAVVVLHGFKGFAAWGFFPWLADALARVGFSTISVDFSRNGIGERPDEFTRLDLFEQNSLAHEIDDVRAVIDHLVAAGIATGAIALLGHSRGGSVALLAAVADPRVAAVVCWAAVANFAEHFPPVALASWRRDGHFDVLNSRTGQTMRLGSQFLAEVDDRSGRFDPCRAAMALDRPLLLLHGTADQSVPVLDASRLASGRGQRRTEMVLVRGADHTFGAVHPFQRETPELREALATTVEFLQKTTTRPATHDLRHP